MSALGGLIMSLENRVGMFVQRDATNMHSGTLKSASGAACIAEQGRNSGK
jgi:hypothetical protein